MRNWLFLNFALGEYGKHFVTHPKMKALQKGLIVFCMSTKMSIVLFCHLCNGTEYSFSSNLRTSHRMN